MKLYISLKSGTGGHYDYDNCDSQIAELDVLETPRVGDILVINVENEGVKSYLVREISRHYNIPCENGKWDYGEFITVYVIPQ